MSDLVPIPNDELKHLAKKEDPRFLSILLRDKDCLMDAMAYGLSIDHFWHEEDKFLFTVMKKYYKQYSAILTRTAMDTLMDKQSSYSEEQKSARKMYWDKVYSVEAPIDDYESLKHSINNRFVQQQAYNILKDNIERIVNATSSQENIVQEIKEGFTSIKGMNADTYSLTMGVEEGIEKAFEYIERRRDHPEEHSGVLTGIKAIDEIMYGFLPGSYTAISGMTNGGKTTLMFNIGFNMARAGYNVVYVSLEKEAVPLFTRLLSLHALVDYNRIKRGGTGDWGLPEHIMDMYRRAKDDLLKNIQPNFDCIQMAQGTKLSKIFAEVDKIKARKKIDVLILDYLGVVGHEKFHQTRPDLDLADSSERVQAYGRINKVVTITAVQLKAASTKEIRNRAKKVGDDGDISGVEVNSEDMAGSQKIVHDADNALGVVLNADKPATKMYVHITKARDNEKGRTIELDFDGKLGRVCDPELSPSQIQSVDDLLYNNDISEEELSSDDDLFDALEKKDEAKSEAGENPQEETVEEPVIESQEESAQESNDDLGFLNEDHSSDVTDDDINSLLG